MKKSQVASKKRQTKKNYKTFFLFLGFTAFLWFALQFSKNYSKEVIFNVEYTGLQEKKIVSSKSDRSIAMMLEGSGLQLLKYAIFNEAIEIDTRKATILDESHAYFTGQKMRSMLKNSLDYTGEISFTSKDSIHIYYDIIKEKEVPVKVVSNIKYMTSFTSLKGVELGQKKIRVTGPKSSIDTLTVLSTKELELVSLREDYKGVLEIDRSKLPENVSITPTQIPVTILVDKLTEGVFKVPISVLNIPKGTQVQLFPKQVGVVFSVTLKDYPKLASTDFHVTVNLKKASPNVNTLLLELTEKPDFVHNVRLSEKEVQYIIIK